ncbi:MAG: hypothetical protein K2X27_19525 [Candidatus Obscuribacterales bacterium]|nr:hypothetical protein [Candidatus Obscuribacterales bacterium]
MDIDLYALLLVMDIFASFDFSYQAFQFSLASPLSLCPWWRCFGLDFFGELELIPSKTASLEGLSLLDDALLN